MDLYFIKATMHGSVYKLSDFYIGSNYKLNPDYKVNVNLKADNLTSIVLPPALTFNPRDFTHIIVPSLDMIYKINRYDYENNNQVKLFLEEDAFISSYHDFITKDIYINRSNSANLFTGLHDIKDIAIKHQANHFSRSVAENYTGLWALFTFQKSDNDITIKTKDLDILPFVEGSGTFTSLGELQAAYPDDDPSVVTPFNVDYYLKFARLTNGHLYQCVWISGVLLWSRVQENMPELEHAATNQFGPMPALASKNSVIVLTGDVDTINIAFPLDCTVSTLINYNIDSAPGNQNVYTTLPSFYNIDSFGDATDDLLSIKIITEEFIIESDHIVYDSGAQKLERYYLLGSGVEQFKNVTLTPSSYRLKVITNNIYSKLNGGKAAQNHLQRANSLIITQFKNIFNFDYSAYEGILNTEPFKKYFISLYGQLIQIPNKYLNFNVRIAITSSDVLYEVYTDKHNVIASGRLQWFTRYALDQLDLFMANNPTYKEQFWTNQISGAIKNIGLGAVGGSLSAGPGLGTAIGVTSSVVSIATNITNLHFMEKGYKDKADEIIGQNDLSMSLLRGYGVYMIEVVPDAVSLNQMIETYNLIGFPCGTKLKPNTIITSGNNVIAGRMLEVVKNNYVTNEINKKLNEGVVVIL